MSKILFVTAFCGLLAFGKHLLLGSPVQDAKLVKWLATAGIISTFATLLSFIYILARRWSVIRLRKKRPDFIEILKMRERSVARNSMLPLVTTPIIAGSLPEIGLVEIDSGKDPEISLSEG